jgi:hypothetical protein
MSPASLCRLDRRHRLPRSRPARLANGLRRAARRRALTVQHRRSSRTSASCRRPNAAGPAASSNWRWPSASKPPPMPEPMSSSATGHRLQPPPAPTATTATRCASNWPAMTARFRRPASTIRCTTLRRLLGHRHPLHGAMPGDLRLRRQLRRRPARCTWSGPSSTGKSPC